MINNFEIMIAKRYLFPGKGEKFIALVAGISLCAVMLGVSALIIVMSVMNGFRAELFDKIIGLNGHMMITGDGGRLADWQQIARSAAQTPNVTKVTPVIERPLLSAFQGRVEPVLIRGMVPRDIRRSAALNSKLIAGRMEDIIPNSANVGIGSRLAENLGIGIGDSITIFTNPGIISDFSVPRQVPYRVSAVFETGIYEYDKTLIVMTIEDAQFLMDMQNTIGSIKIETLGSENVDQVKYEFKRKLDKNAHIKTWKEFNKSLFQALLVERVAMFVVLSIIVLVAVFNILSSLIMLVRSKKRDIAIVRTMGASRISIIKIFIFIGFTIGSAGTVAGLAAGLVFLFVRTPIVAFIKFISNKDISDPGIRFLIELPSSPNFYEISVICFMSLFLSFIATLYPAFKAASIDPVQVLRHD